MSIYFFNWLTGHFKLITFIKDARVDLTGSHLNQVVDQRDGSDRQVKQVPPILSEKLLSCKRRK